MWLFYEHPDADAEGLKLKFMDIRKRTYKFPKLGTKCKMVAIPTTSGTGSEVTSFAVITDKEKNKKYPLADYELTPDVAIVDPDLVMSLAKISYSRYRNGCINTCIRSICIKYGIRLYRWTSRKSSRISI